MDLTNHALVVIDLQQRIVALDTKPHPTGAVLARAGRLANAFRRCGLPVVLVRTVNLDRPDGEGDRIATQLTPQAGDLLLTKHQWGAFHGTPLDLHLRRRGVRGVVLAGVMTNFGIESTARAADELGYAIVLVSDAASSLTCEAHEFSLREVFPRLGATITTTDRTLRTLRSAEEPEATETRALETSCEAIRQRTGGIDA
jgi:nicotinamidase-related amidase